MQAIEIQAAVKEGVLQVPTLPTPLAGGAVKLIVLCEEQSTLSERNYDLEKMKEAFSEVSEKAIFSSIKDPVAWQRQQRDEWEQP